MLTSPSDQLTPREAVLMQNERESNKEQMDYGEKMKRLDIEMEKLQARWSALLRIPMTIIKLPVFIILAIGYVVCMAKGKEPSEQFWNFLK